MRVCDLSADDLYDGELQGASNAKSLLTALKKRVNAQAFGNRKQDKKGSVTSVVKSGAQKRILEPALVPIIDLAVQYVSLAFHRASHVLNYIVTRCCEDNMEIPNILDCGTYIDAVVRGDCSHNLIRIEHQEAFQAWPMPQRPTGFGSPVAQLYRNTYQTSVANTITMAFDSRLKSYVRSWATYALGKVSKKEVRVIADCIRGWTTSSDDRALLVPLAVQFIMAERTLLGLNVHGAARGDAFVQSLQEDTSFRDQRISGPWLKERYKHILQSYHRWLVVVEGAQVSKAWTLVPLSKLRRQHIHIDTNVLHTMMTAAKLIKCSRGAFTALAEEHFSSCFDVSGLVSSDRYAFDNHVATDGVAVSWHFSRKPTRDEVAARNMPKKKGGSVQSQELSPGPLVQAAQQGERIVAIDPGKKAIFTGVEVLPSGDRRTFVLTSREYRERSGMLQALAHSTFDQRHIAGALNLLSHNTPKRSGTLDLQAHASAMAQVLPELWRQFSRRAWSRRRFGIYIKRMSVLDSFFSRIKSAGQGPVNIAYGSAGFAASAPGRPPSPTTSAAKRAITFFGKHRVFCIDKFRTTMMDHLSEERLHNVLVHDPVKGKLVAVHGLKLSRSSEVNLGLVHRQTRLVHRDINAALNILKIAVSPTRPEYLERGLNVGTNVSHVLRRRSHISWARRRLAKLQPRAPIPDKGRMS